jgi:hypothetical protein
MLYKKLTNAINKLSTNQRFMLGQKSMAVFLSDLKEFNKNGCVGARLRGNFEWYLDLLADLTEEE